ncbi:MAG: ribosome maturation factor RimP [Desulfovibrionaceae bacterium]|nr:ribosome maturation factor RimP [Desulfovibrionaceae bacterium]
MTNSSLHEKLLQLALPAVRAQGLDIWGLELIEGGQMLVRLYVEKGPGAEAPASGSASATQAPDSATDGSEEQSVQQLSATVNQCESISRQFSLALDAEDVIDRAYTLEVSTPGFNRIFFGTSQMQDYIGDMVEARLPNPWSPGEGLPARRTWKGRLLKADSDTFTIAPATVDADGIVTDEALPEAVIPFDRARRVSRMHIFVRPQKPGKKHK